MDKSQTINHPLFQHLRQYTSLPVDDFPVILSAFKTIETPKKEHLMLAHQVCRSHFFVLEGCLHMYYINQNGAKRTIQFALEKWWITDYLAFGQQKLSEFYIQTVEPSRVLQLSDDAQNKLLTDYPNLEKYFRSIYQIAYGSFLHRMKLLTDFSKEEIYLHFVRHYPDFAQRIPQYLIASFLDLTPEYVSEIRRKQLS